MKRPIVLIIMDGLGLAKDTEGNAVTRAEKPNLDYLMKTYPQNTLEASGLAVGLPEGQMGNSEVGHMNLGGGRVVYQSLTRIHQSIKDETFFENEAYLDAIDHVKKKDSKLHIMGLLSNGGVHSHIDHFKAMLDLAKDKGIKQVYVHAFLDGRDVPPKSALEFTGELEDYMEKTGKGSLASVHGRYYAMDRDKNWDRVQKAYDILTRAEGDRYESAEAGIKANYDEDITDEFVIPFNIDPEGTIKKSDAIIHMNFRPDRAIQLSTALTNPSETGIDNPLEPEDLHFVSTMHYSPNVKGSIAFGLQELDDMYGEVIAGAGLKQLRIAETEKYAHVTFFFDGGEDKEIENADRVLVASPKVATYDMKPEMSAYEVTDKVLAELEKGTHDTIILNYANCDMVGHTGDIEAAIKAVEVTDECVGIVTQKVTEKGGVSIVTADHGNAEKMLDEKGGSHTAHTNSLVPIVITDNDITIRDGGILGDIAPTMLDYLGVDKPKAMTGKTLINKK